MSRLSGSSQQDQSDKLSQKALPEKMEVKEDSVDDVQRVRFYTDTTSTTRANSVFANVAITGTKKKKDESTGKVYTTYTIEVNYGASSYQLHKRYRDFVDLHEQLVAIEFLLMESTLPKLPPSKVFGNLDPMFVHQRRGELEVYLQGVLNLPQFANSAPLLAFLAERA